MAKVVGLRTEILTTITLLLGASLLLGGVLMLRLTEQNLLNQRVSQLSALTQTLATSLLLNRSSTENSSLSAQSAQQLLNKLPAALHHQSWRVYDQNLKLLTSFDADVSESLTEAALQRLKLSGELSWQVFFPSLLQIYSDAGAWARYAIPLTRLNQFQGILEIHFSLQDIRNRLRLSLRMILIYVLVYGAILVLVGYYLMQRNVVAPAKNLLRATEDVRQGNLDTRLPVAGPSEIADLAIAYNEMVDVLRASRLETREHIQELKQTNEQLRQARDELFRSEKLASVGQLAAGLAHEIGNPLAALIGYLEIIKSQLSSTSHRDVLQRSLVEAGRIDLLVRELLDFSRPSDDLYEKLDPAKLLSATVELLKHQGVFKRLTVADQLPESLPDVNGSHHKLQQTYINLLLNAAQACAEGGRIVLSAGCQDDSVWIKVTDNGCGIEEKDYGKIFDPFFTTKEPGKGTGLGLAICHRAMEEFGGRIEMKSIVAEGSEFMIHLPIDREAVKEVKKVH